MTHVKAKTLFHFYFFTFGKSAFLFLCLFVCMKIWVLSLYRLQFYYIAITPMYVLLIIMCRSILHISTYQHIWLIYIFYFLNLDQGSNFKYKQKLEKKTILHILRFISIEIILTTKQQQKLFPFAFNESIISYINFIFIGISKF